VVVGEGEIPTRRVIMYSDFAAWVLDQVELDEYLYKTVSIYSDTTMSEIDGLSFERTVREMKEIKAQVEADLAADAQNNQ
jgi:hypothetical protein